MKKFREYNFLRSTVKIEGIFLNDRIYKILLETDLPYEKVR
jgi:hypothetical protein